MTLNKLLDNQGKIIQKLEQVIARLDQVDNRLGIMDKKIVESFDKTNEKDFFEVLFKK